ncbi:MAG: DUF1036 domain-containing protein [Rhizobiales bacterium]|nr:DUF1036 domain-containing protein [Hyphomicrobiales bacterium]
MSYVVEAALGLEDDNAVATRGWFRIDPGQCRTVLQGTIEAQRILLHAEALPLYGAPPLPQTGHADLCIARGDFIIAAARVCTRADQRLARFTEVKPADSERGQTVKLAEEAEYDDAQARLAGIQRLLVMAGYDANPIDGIQGKKTDAAIAQFLKDRKLPADTVNSAAFFDTLVEAAQRPDGINFVWCNETTYAVMAALGVENRGTIVTRGWFRIEAGRCLRPDLRDKPRRLYSYAEAVDAGGQVAIRGGKRLTWGGETVLCTRNVRFELSEHGDCQALGLTGAGFATIDTARSGPATVRFTVP